VQKNVVEDETDFVQLGQNTETEFLTMRMGLPEDSAWTVYPEKYKFISMAVFMSSDSEVTNRETYEFLGYLGDIGGLIDVLRLGLAAIAYYFNQNRLNALLTSSLFHLNRAENE
jgi:hypothetical protein